MTKNELAFEILKLSADKIMEHEQSLCVISGSSSNLRYDVALVEAYNYIYESISFDSLTFLGKNSLTS